MTAMGASIYAELLAALEQGVAVALATVTDTRQSVPRRAGTKMLIHADGRTSGTIGGGEMESRVVREAMQALADGRPRRLTYSLVDPAGGDPGVCGGEMEIYVEPHGPEPTVLVIGCGHVGRAVVELAHWIGLRVLAYDDRAELASAESLPLADAVYQDLAEVPITAATDVVVVTRNVGVDLQVLPILLASPARSIGVMGSRRRWATTRDALAARGCDAAALDRVIAPIGLELHAESPQEIAVSIVGQLIGIRRGPGDAAG